MSADDTTARTPPELLPPSELPGRLSEDLSMSPELAERVIEDPFLTPGPPGRVRDDPSLLPELLLCPVMGRNKLNKSSKILEHKMAFIIKNIY